MKTRIWIVLALLVPLVCSLGGVTGNALERSIDLDGFKVILGEQETLLGNGAFGLHYLPDNCVSVIDTSPTYRIIMAAGNSTYLLEGKRLEELTSCEKILGPGGTGEFDNGYAGIAGVYRDESGKLYGFYHAEDHKDMPTMETGIPGFYACIGLALSEDNGKTWKKVGPVITSSKPKGWYDYEGQADSGIGEPCSVVSKDGKYLFVYYTAHSRVDDSGGQICMARVDLDEDLSLPGKWYKYYQGSFSEPGIGGRASVVLGQGLQETVALYPHVVYSRCLDLYLIVFNMWSWQEHVSGTGLKRSGLYIAHSVDGITWSKPTMLIKDWPIPLTNKTISWQPTLLFDEGSASEGWLVYGYSERWGHEHQGGIPHYMVGRRIKFEKTVATDTVAPAIAGVVQSPAADEVDPRQAVTVTAAGVVDNVAVERVLLRYSTDDAASYNVTMTPISGTSNYAGRIPGAINAANAHVTYRISAGDTSGNWKETGTYAYRVRAAPSAARDVSNADETVTVQEVPPPTIPRTWIGIGVVAVAIVVAVVAAYMLTQKKP